MNKDCLVFGHEKPTDFKLNGYDHRILEKNYYVKCERCNQMFLVNVELTEHGGTIMTVLNGWPSEM